MKNTLKKQVWELVRRVDFPLVAYLYETGRIIAASPRAEYLIGENMKNINFVWQDSNKQKLSKEVLDNGSVIFYQKYISNKKDRIVIDLEINSICINEEHLVLVLFEQSYKCPFNKIYFKVMPRILWRDKKLELAGKNTFISDEEAAEIHKPQTEFLKSQEGQFDVLLEIKVGEDITSFATLNQIVLKNKNGTSIGTLTTYTLIPERETSQSYLDDLQRENYILKMAVSKTNHIAVTWEKGEDGIVNYISPNISKLGYNCNDFYENEVNWRQLVVPEDYPLFKQKNMMEESLSGDACSIEYRLQKKNGDIIWIKDETVDSTLKDGIRYKQGIICEIDNPHILTRLTASAAQRKEKPNYVMFYQPVIDGGTKHCVGAEALLRGSDSDKGLIGPMEVLSMSEYLGFMSALGEFIFKEAFSMCKEFNDSVDKDFKVHVNLSIMQLTQPDILNQIIRVLKETNANASNIVFEVKESLAMEDLKLMKKLLKRLKDFGFTILLDNFGTGAAALNTLVELPLDYIKMDEVFIHTYGTEKFKPSLLTAIVDLAHSLSIKVIVSGIETKKQKDFLFLSDIDGYQGYYFGYPVPKTSFQWKGELK